MKDIARLTDHQRTNLSPSTWWDPIAKDGKGNSPTRPVEILGEPVAHQLTGELLVSVRRPTKDGIGQPFTMAIDTLTSSYVPRVAAAVVAVEEPPQMTLPRFDMPPWAVEMERQLAYLVACEKARAGVTVKA